jgi:hypothetical protein
MVGRNPDSGVQPEACQACRDMSSQGLVRADVEQGMLTRSVLEQLQGRNRLAAAWWSKKERSRPKLVGSPLAQELGLLKCQQ